MTNRWTNKNYKTFIPKNIFVIGAMPDLNARKDFEYQIIKKINATQVNALQSHVVFVTSLNSVKSRIWYSTSDIIEASNVRKSASDYVKVVIKSLQKRRFYLKKI